MNLYRPDNIAVIIVNYNNADLTIKCLESIFNLEQQPKDIIVVDNSSYEYDRITSEWRNLSHIYKRIPHYLCTSLEKFPSTGDVFISLKVNNGFSFANNIAIKSCLQRNTGYKGFWIVNNDTILDRHSLKNICKRMNSFPLIDICGSTILFLQNKNMIQCASGGCISRITGRTQNILENTSLRQYSSVEQLKIESKLDYINGASLFISMNVIQTIGLLSEEYFLYYEDCDFCIRAKRHNFYLGWAPDSIIYHADGASSKKSPKKLEYYSTRSRLYFLKNHTKFGKIVFIMTLPFFILSNFLRGNFSYMRTLYNILLKK